MKRRQLLQLPIALAFATSLQAADKPWSARLLRGGFDGKTYWSGIAITLAPKWKTYWRVPGDGGIAPQFEITGVNLKSHQLEYPAPDLYVDAAGLTIGYKDEVVFPLSIEAEDLSQPVKLNLKAFIGVCDEVCIPAQFDLTQEFGPKTLSLDDQSTINAWRMKVPTIETIGPVLKATASETAGSFAVRLELSEALKYVLVEGNPKHYFGKASNMDRSALIAVTGAKTLDELRARPLRLTIKTKYGSFRALEQTVKVD